MVYIWVIAMLGLLLYTASYVVTSVAMLFAAVVHLVDVFRPPRIVRVPKKSRLP